MLNPASTRPGGYKQSLLDMAYCKFLDKFLDALHGRVFQINFPPDHLWRDFRVSLLSGGETDDHYRNPNKNTAILANTLCGRYTSEIQVIFKGEIE